MKKLLAALLLAAAPAFAQTNGWQEIQNGWGEIQTALGSYATMPAPTGCVATSVPFFLGSPVALGCDAGLTYNAVTDTLAPANVAALYHVAAGTIAALGSQSTSYKGLYLGNAGSVTWSDAAQYWGTADVGLARTAAGALKATNGSTGIGQFQAGTVLNPQTGTSYALLAADNGKTLTFTNGSDITLTVGAGLPVGFNVLIIQLGAGTVAPTASSTTIYQRQSYTKTAGQYAAASLVSTATDVFILSGDLQP